MTLVGRMRRTLSVLAAFALAAALTPPPLPVLASALPSPGTTAMVSGLQQLSVFTAGLGSIGALGKPLPLLDVTPGGSDGFAFAPAGSEQGLFDGAVYQAIHDEETNLEGSTSGTVEVADLAAGSPYHIDLPGANVSDPHRIGTLTVNATGSGSVQQLVFNVSLTRDLAGEGLRVSGLDSGGQEIDLTTANGVSVHLTLTAHFVATVDTSFSTPYFYLVHDGSGPSITVGATATIPSPGSVKAAIGILGVTLGSVAFQATENLTASLDDPNNDGQLAFTNSDGSTVGELGQPGALTGLAHVNFGSPAGAVDDGSGHQASFGVVTDHSSGLPLPDVSATINAFWPDVSAGAPTLGATSGYTSAADFLNLTPKDLADGIQHLANTIVGVQRAQWNDGSMRGNLNLPFMKGSLADAIDASSVLRAFITEYTSNPSPKSKHQTTDPAQIGQPLFASLQDLIGDLTNPSPALTGGSIVVGTVDFNNSTSGPDKVSLPLTITGSSGGAVDLDVQPLLAAGTGSYTASTLTDAALAGVGFDTSLAGQTVTVVDGNTNKTETGVIDHVSGNVLTLKEQTQIGAGVYWVVNGNTAGPTPAASSPYSIKGADPGTGAAAFGNLFNAAGITNANQQALTPNSPASTAKVTRTYTLKTTLVLNLVAPIKEAGCNTSAAATAFPQYPELPKACPFTHTNPDGSSVLIAQLPTNTDRTMLRTGATGPLLVADFPISSPVDLGGMVGFLQVHLAGTLTMAVTSGHMLTISLQPQTVAGSTDLTLDQVARLLVTGSSSTPSTFLTETVNATVSASLAVDVPDSSTGSTPSYFGSAPPTISLPAVDITNLGAAAPNTSALTSPDLNDFNFDPDHPTALLGPTLKSLQVLDSSLAGLSTRAGLFSTTVPTLGRSLGALLAAQDSGGGGNVTYGADNLTDAARPYTAPAGNDPGDQALVGRAVLVGTQVMTIKTVEGVNSNAGTKLTFSAAFATQPPTGTAYSLNSALAGAVASLIADPPTTLQDALARINSALGDGTTFIVAGIDTSGSTPAVKLGLDWKRKARTGATLTLTFTPDCTSCSPVQQTLIASSTFTVPITITEESIVGVEVPLAPGNGPANAAGLTITGNSTLGGTLMVSVDDTSSPDAIIGPLVVKLGNGTDHLQVDASYALSLGNSGGTGTKSLDTLLGETATATAPGVGCSDDPLHTTGLGLCAVIPVYDLTSTSLGPVIVRLPSSGSDMFSTSASGNVDPGPKALGDAVAAATINLGSLLDGVDHYLAMAEQTLAAASFDGKLPLIGHDLQVGSDFIGALKTEFDSEINSLFISTSPATKGDIDAAAASLQTALASQWTGATVTDNVTCTGACASGTPIGDVTQVEFTIKLGASPTVNAPPLNVGIPGLSLHSNANTTGFSAGLSWGFDAILGVSRDDGFYVKPDGSNAVVQATASVTAPSNFSGQLAFLTMDMSTHAGGSNPCGTVNACLTAKVNLSGKISAADLANPSDVISQFSIDVSGNIYIDWDFHVSIAVNGDDELLPGISGEFKLTWSVSASTSSGLQTGDLDIEFDNVSLDAGTFLSGVFGKIIQQIKSVTDPLRPVIDQIQAPIPVLSDLSHLVGGGDVTIESIAEAFNTLAGGPDLELVHRLVAILDFIQHLPNCSSSCSISLGSFVIAGSNADKALNTPNTPTYAADPSSVGNASGAPSASQFVTDLNNANSSDSNFFADPPSSSSSNCAPDPTKVAGGNSAAKGGLWFPFIDNPTSLFGILLGSDVTLACFDSGKLSLGFNYSQAFGPVYAPPPVLVTISGSASVSLQIVGGFDTYGMRTAVEQAKPVRFLSSLFFATTNQDGSPLAVVAFTGRLAAGAEVSAVIITVGVEGGIELTVSFTWRDPDNDGKFRFDEFLQTALSNPLCLFNVSGSFSVFLDVFITIGIGPFSTTFDINLINVKLLDFSLSPNCTPPPPTLGTVPASSHTLVLFAGALGHSGTTLRGDPAWDTNNTADETWKITQYHDPNSNNAVTGYAVDALGVHSEFPSSVDTVLLDGRGYQGNLTVIFQGAIDPKFAPSNSTAQGQTGQTQTPQHLPFTATAVVLGGDGTDNIKGGQGANYIDGGAGNDTITTADISGGSGSFIAGGLGNDTITVGNADDHVAGDSALVLPANKTWPSTAISVIDWNLLPSFPSNSALGVADASGGGDTVGAGLGNDVLWGNGGDDHINVAPDPQGGSVHSPGVTIVGGDGSDVINGGTGPDHIYTGEDLTQTTEDATGGADACAAGGVCDSGLPVNVVNTGGGFDPKTGQVIGGGNDFVYGSTGEDIVSGHSATNQTDTIFGGGGNDVLSGGYGTDKIYGGPGNDYVLAEPSQISDVVNSHDTVNGIDYGPLRNVTHDALPSGVASSIKLLVGGGGNDHIFGGDGGATIFGDSGTEAGCPTTNPPPAAATPPSEAGQTVPPDGNDRIAGGAGTDVIQAGGGDDLADSGTGTDFVCGGAGNDTLTSHSLVGQLDIAYGGSGNDVMSGGDGNDYLFGNSGDDHLYSGIGNDTLEGNDGVDVIFGGSGNDLLIGGTSAAGQLDEGDTLSGDVGNDVLIGDNGAQESSPGVADMGPPAGVNTGDQVVSYDLSDGNGLSSHGGADLIFGGDGTDIAYGGLDKDLIYGGTSDDHLEGGPGTDTVYGESGQDDIIGGSSQVVSGSPAPAAQTAVGYPDTGDLLYGGTEADVILADNGAILRSGQIGFDASNAPLTQGRVATPRTVLPYDLGDSPTASTFGNDFVDAGTGDDVVLGQNGHDRVLLGDGNDYAEGGPGQDWLQGDAGDDDLVGGSSFVESGSGNAAVGQPDMGDLVLGGAGDDVIAGDNAQIVEIAGTGITTPRLFLRLSSTGSLFRPRTVTLLDLNGPTFLVTPDSIRFGGDQIDGGAGNDVAFGQDGDDAITGGTGDDYLEGNGGADLIKGDLPLDQVPPDGYAIAGFINPDDWAGNVSGLPVLGYVPPAPDSLAGLDATTCGNPATTQCQDDIIGGSPIQAFRDANDVIEGDLGDDFVLADNGTLVRDVSGSTETTFTQRSPATTIVRHHDNSIGGLTSTRFCTTTQATCEPAGAFGGDTVFGDTGNDNIWGQDGNDILYGGLGNDDMYGELGSDYMDGGPGDDVMLGDRGGAVDNLENGSRSFTTILSNVPQETYVGLSAGVYDRQVDLLHDVDGAGFVGSSSSAAMRHNGMTEGGDDVMVGGPGRDSMHGGAGNDVMDGDSGGDIVFGDDGADVLYGGQGCDPSASLDKQDLADACPIVGGQPDLTARGANDRWLDYVFGGKGGTDAVSLAGDLGSDLLDFAPRGSASICTSNPWPVIDPDGTIHDPCTWFLVTIRNQADPLVHQDHQGTDWLYGGWDRDVMQGDVAANGPNPGDRLIDWTGSYNLYTHCNAAYGGYNDIRQFSPAMTTFLQLVAWGSGAGQVLADAKTSGTSAFDELAQVYPSDNNAHGSGSAYPATPGHFDVSSCVP